MKGKLTINIPLALALKSADASTKTSDPYCRIELPDGHTIQTKQVEKCLDPIWNFTYVWNCNIIKEQYKPIVITIFDTDALARDDSLGAVQVEWMTCFTNPTAWEVNRLMKLEGE
jgi:Ca2+-dependent lipid-binding protein